MVVVNIVIKENSINKIDASRFNVEFGMECNLLKREDWKEREWALAKKIESLTLELVNAVDPKHRTKRID